MTDKSVAPIMVMGNASNTIAYRAVGNQTVCLQSPDHGIQQLVGFDPANGDVIGLDDILETTTAQTNLSDVGKYLTSQTTSAGTMLYFDATGSGKVGTPVAMLQGVSTTIAALVANHGIAYIPDAFTATQQFNQPFTFRPCGMETLKLTAPAAGVTSQIFGFDPSKADVLDVTAILNPTTARPDLSNAGNYLHATNVNGDTVLSVDKTGAGGAGTAFAVLKGETTSISNLVQGGALIFKPTPIEVGMQPGVPFEFRPEGQEVAVWNGMTHIEGFSGSTDAINIVHLLASSKVNATASTIGNFVSATQSGGNETLWLDPTGHGNHTSAFAVLDNTNLSFSAIAGALHIK